IGILFHQDAHQWVPLGEVGAREMTVAAREGCRQLQAMSPQDRSKILLSIADALEENERLIAIENEADVAGYEQSLIAWLTLKPGKAKLWSICV
ncbi:delta-1-pyrroline-5-carboxylate synthase-like, partial [Camellia sinensis]|uniref:delta-1-pyrroline-5-carboxylate synthase-like n=1 Tax=Camellia sinensis TaxID=4442 RepID=UPI001035BA97